MTKVLQPVSLLQMIRSKSIKLVSLIHAAELYGERLRLQTNQLTEEDSVVLCFFLLLNTVVL